MGQIDLTTPALLFPAISLLLLAYTNRFLHLAQLVRNLHAAYHQEPDALIIGQIANLRRRIVLIRNMQVLGVLSLFLCVAAMLFIFFGRKVTGEIIFGFSLLLLLGSLALSAWEVQISIRALNLHLSDVEKDLP